MLAQQLRLGELITVHCLDELHCISSISHHNTYPGTKQSLTGKAWLELSCSSHCVVVGNTVIRVVHASTAPAAAPASVSHNAQALAR